MIEEDFAEWKIIEKLLTVCLIIIWFMVIVVPFGTTGVYHEAWQFILSFSLTMFIVSYSQYIRVKYAESKRIEKENEEYYQKMNKNPGVIVKNSCSNCKINEKCGIEMSPYIPNYLVNNAVCRFYEG